MNRPRNHIRSIRHLIRQEHRDLARTVRCIDRLFTEPIDDDAYPIVAGQVERELIELRDHLARHFHQEETEGFLDEAAAAVPRLAAEAEQVKAEHPLLLRKLDELIGDLRRRGHALEGLKQVSQSYRGFARLLLDHEAAENRLLQIGYNEDFDLET